MKDDSEDANEPVETNEGTTIVAILRNPIFWGVTATFSLIYCFAGVAGLSLGLLDSPIIAWLNTSFRNGQMESYKWEAIAVLTNALALVWIVVTVVLQSVQLKLQRSELRLNREEIKISQEELRQTRKETAKMASSLETQAQIYKEEQIDRVFLRAEHEFDSKMRVCFNTLAETSERALWSKLGRSKTTSGLGFLHIVEKTVDSNVARVRSDLEALISLITSSNKSDLKTVHSPNAWQAPINKLKDAMSVQERLSQEQKSRVESFNLAQMKKLIEQVQGLAKEYDGKPV